MAAKVKIKHTGAGVVGKFPGRVVQLATGAEGRTEAGKRWRPALQLLQLLFFLSLYSLSVLAAL